MTEPKTVDAPRKASLRHRLYHGETAIDFVGHRNTWFLVSAVVHDILVTVGVYSISRFEVTPATVVAFLTILGYSLYDTIVVFDKVQENTKGVSAQGRLTYSDTVNLSMNQVLMRSINTSIVA